MYTKGSLINYKRALNYHERARTKRLSEKKFDYFIFIPRVQLGGVIKFDFFYTGSYDPMFSIIHPLHPAIVELRILILNDSTLASPSGSC
jgi:hypothetical protein